MASSKVKGIIVEIGGDTSGLQKALEKTNSISSKLQKELKAVNKSLKFDPKNTELLEQKQKLLNDEIAITTTRLEELKKHQEEVKNSGKTLNKEQLENYRALQREIINTQNKLNNLKNENSKWNKTGTYLTNLGNELDTISDKIDKVGNKLTLGLTVPVVAGFTKMTQSAIENETAVQQVDRIYGEAAESIKDFAENKAIDYNMSASEAYKYSQIYGNLIQSITDDQTENATKTQELLQASSVIASATGRSMEDVMDRIRSGLLGNTEAIEDLGVNVNVALLETTDAFKQIAGDRSWDKLEFQEQQQIRLLGILEQTSKRYGDEVQDNTASSIQKLTAKTKNLTNDLGKKLLPIANKVLEKANDLVEGFNDLSDEQKDNIVKIGLMVAAAGPLLKVGSTAVSTVGKVTSGLGTMTKAIGVASGKMSSTETSVNNLANVFKATFSPTGLAVLGITAAVGIIVAQIEKAEAEMKSKFEAMGTAATDFYNDLQTAEGYLDSFNQTIFASSEEQENLQKQMEEIQAGITQICKTASDERRDYTQEEITQLDEYFTKLRELKDREIEIYQSRIETITQLAQSESTAFQGSIEEYKERGTEWIATARDQANEIISIAENRRIEEIASLREMYSDEERLTNENYLNAVAQAEENYQQAVAAANKQVGEVSAIYSNGYVERAKQEDSFLNILGEYNKKVEEESNRHNQKMQDIEDGNFNWVLGKTEDRHAEAVKHHDAMKDIWEDMYENMSEEQIKEMGVWLARLADTELYGGEISEENQKMVDAILDNYNTMPEEAREIMKETMSPMLEEMEKSKPTLWAKASGIADGILSRLRSSFDIHSPSRETRNIFQNVMKGAELGLEDEQRKLNKQVDIIANQMKAKFSNMMPNMGAIKQSVIDQTQTVFTTPNITFNVQQMDEANLNTAFNYINRRLGSQY